MDSAIASRQVEIATLRAIGFGGLPVVVSRACPTRRLINLLQSATFPRTRRASVAASGSGGATAVGRAPAAGRPRKDRASARASVGDPVTADRADTGGRRRDSGGRGPTEASSVSARVKTPSPTRDTLLRSAGLAARHTPRRPGVNIRVSWNHHGTRIAASGRTGSVNVLLGRAWVALTAVHGPTYLALKAGITCAEKRSSCSRITAWGVPTGWPTLTTSRPGYLCWSSINRSVISSGGPISHVPALIA
jgi:hypothetical protein